MTDTEFDATISNWVRWVRSNPGGGNRCRSLESRYRSPQAWHPEAPRMELDVLSAERVEDAVVALPPKKRHLIVYAYLTPTIDIHSICRKVGIRTWHFKDELDKAKVSLMARLA